MLKWLILAVLAVGLGLIWQNVETRKLLLSEIQSARRSINDFTARYEGWQVMFASFGIALVLASLYSFLFDENIYTLKQRISSMFFRNVQKLPIIGTKIRKDVDSMLKTLEKESFTPKPNETYRTELPKKGLSHNEVLLEMSGMDDLAEIEWADGWVSGALYNSNPELTKLTTAVFEKHVWSNPLHLDVFPQIRKMEAEVVQWTAKLFNGDENVCGVMSSGGTESILLAMKSYREMGYARGIKYPEIVCPVSTHCAFNKAAEFFRMKITQVPVDPCTRMVNLKAMARAINSNTIVVVGSAPQFPHGIIDPIQDIAKLALKHNIGCHVDCCLGGFILPFMEKAGYKLDPFDFRVKGVTTISADTHKFGYTPKGSSVLLYANKELRHNQYFVDPNWQGGIYATAGISGSRPGCLIATAWATLLYMGENGYVEATRKIIKTARTIVNSVQNVAGIRVIGKPKAMVIAFDSADFDILRLTDQLCEKGWNLNVLQYPPSFHLCVTVLHTKKGVANRFINDLKESVAAIMKDPNAKSTGQAALYGKAASIPDRSIVNEFARAYLDLTYKATPPSQ